ncbi:MAG: hypoxanthine phosphoribosyltransferase, partial [Clostridiales bacterium]
SYGHATVHSGKVKIVQDIEADLSDYDVLVVDDIADSGVTLEFIMKHLASKNPKSLASCVLLDKPSRRVTDIEADYVGFTIPDKFIVGYGLNYGHHYRNVPYIFAFVD